MKLVTPLRNLLQKLLHRGVRGFERRYGYDAAYMHRLADQSPSAFLRLSSLPLVSQYRGPREGVPVWAGAALASTLEGGCGSCAQLIVNMAREAGVDAASLQAAAEGDGITAGPVGLGYRFARAVIAEDPASERLREDVLAQFGPDTLIAASFAAASGRWYPVFKRGFGETMSCAPLQFDGVAAAG